MIDIKFYSRFDKKEAKYVYNSRWREWKLGVSFSKVKILGVKEPLVNLYTFKVHLLLFQITLQIDKGGKWFKI